MGRPQSQNSAQLLIEYVVKDSAYRYIWPMPGGRVKKILTLMAFPLFITATILVVFLFREDIWQAFSSAERIQEVVASWGVSAPLGFIFLQFIQVVIFIIPGEIPQIAGGFLFGMWLGSFYSIAGILLGSAFNFFLARLLGVPFVRTLFKPERIGKFNKITHSTRAQIAFFLLFVIPGIPKDSLCYVAGLSSLRFPAFLFITTVGRLPGIIGSAAMGDAAASSRWVLAIIILSIATILFVLGLIFRERIHVFIERFALRQRREGKLP